MESSYVNQDVREKSHWHHRFEGFFVGGLILIAGVWIYGQYRFQTDQKIFYVGFIEGEWHDTGPNKTGVGQAQHAKVTVKEQP